MSQASAFGEFKKKANADLAEIFKQYAPPWEVTAPAYLDKYLRGLLVPDDEGNIRRISIDTIKPSQGQATVFVVVPADMEVVEKVCAMLTTVPNYTRTLLVIPRVSEFVLQAVKNSGLVGVSAPSELSQDPKERRQQVILKEFHADFQFVDTDFFLLPCTRTVFHSAIEKDYSDLYAGARALAKIQMVFGGIPHVVTVGEHANIVQNLMDGMLDQTRCSTEGVPQIDTLIIIDRMVDLVTPMATPVSMEGLLDQLFGIEYGWYRPDEDRDFVEVGEKWPVFRSLRCLSIVEADKLRNSEEILEPVREGDWLKKLKQTLNDARKQQLLAYCVRVGEAVVNNNLALVLKTEGKLMMEGASIMQLAMNYLTVLGDIRMALRLTYLNRFALGRKAKSSNIFAKSKDDDEETLIKELVAECGLAALETIATIEKMSPKDSSWLKIRDALHCCDCPEDPMYEVCDKFIPPSVQIVKMVTQGKIEALKSQLPRSCPVNSVEKNGAKAASASGRNILVFFAGGATLSEVGYIRRMSSLVFENQVSYIVGATNQLNSRVFLDELTPGLFDTKKKFE